MVKTFFRNFDKKGKKIFQNTSENCDDDAFIASWTPVNKKGGLVKIEKWLINSILLSNTVILFYLTFIST